MFSRHESIQYTLDIATGKWKNEQYFDWNYYYAWGEFEYWTQYGEGHKEAGSCSITSPPLLNDPSKIIIQIDVIISMTKLWNPKTTNMLSHPHTLGGKNKIKITLNLLHKTNLIA